MTSSGDDATASLLRSFDRASTTLSLVETRVESSLNEHFPTNPIRILQRLQAVEKELSLLRQAAEKNAAAKREVLGTLFSQQDARHQKIVDLARRAKASVSEENGAWEAAKEDAQSSLSQRGISSLPPSTANDNKDVACTVPLLAKEDHRFRHVTLSQWTALPPVLRCGISHQDVNTVWRCIRNHAMRLESFELEATQLLAIGIHTSEDHTARALRILEHVGLIAITDTMLCVLPFSSTSFS